MRIEQRHTLGQQHAMQKIEGFLEDLIHRPLPAGVAIQNPQKGWTDNRMDFSFVAAKGFFGVTIHGYLVVTDDLVVLESPIPTLVNSLVGEARIRETVSRALSDVLTS